MNVITLTGNNVKDIELKYSPSGTGIANGTIAVRRDFKNQQGEYETDFINFTAIGKISEVMANHIRKGDKFGINGRLQIRKYNDKYYTEVIVNGFDFPDKKKQQQSQNKPAEDPFHAHGVDISDEEMLPF
jgi:single-strand DNA-binding protein